MFYYIKNNTYLQHKKERTVPIIEHGQSSKTQKGNKDGIQRQSNLSCTVIIVYYLYIENDMAKKKKFVKSYKLHYNKYRDMCM